jgi:hypothetical protein
MLEEEGGFPRKRKKDGPRFPLSAVRWRTNSEQRVANRTGFNGNETLMNVYIAANNPVEYPRKEQSFLVNLYPTLSNALRTLRATKGSLIYNHFSSFQVHPACDIALFLGLCVPFAL